MTLADVNHAIDQTYLMADKGIIKILLASIIAHRLSTPPVFLFIVGPSAGGKTSFLEILNKVHGVQLLSEITPNTFLSGMKNYNKETSFLHEHPNAILLLKDFTTILNLHHEARGRIMSQLREIYDKKFVKRLGTGDHLVWGDGAGHKISLLAGTTDEIYAKRELYAAMGERFIMYYPHQPGRKEVTRRAMGNITGFDTTKDILAELVKKYLDQEIQLVDEEHEKGWLPQITEKLRNRLIDLADFTTLSRSPVQRDNYSPGKEMLYKNDPEMPTRFAMQLETLALAFMIMNRHDGLGEALTKDDENIIYKIALDSITITRRNVMRKLTEYEAVTTVALAEDMKYPANTLRRWLEDLTALGIIEVKKGRTHGKRDDEWILKQEYRDLITRYEGVKQTHESLTKDPDEPGETVPVQTNMTIEEFEAELNH